LAALPVIWWILRVTPPAPRRLAFPPARLLFDILKRDESSAKSPWWLLLLRLILAAAVILGAAHPLLNAARDLRGEGPLVLVVDDGWAAAADWPSRQAMMGSLLDQAERDSRPVMVITTAPGADEKNRNLPQVLQTTEARRLVESLQPKPWATDRKAALAPVTRPEQIDARPPGHVVWLSDGLDRGGAADVVGALQQLGVVTVVADPAQKAPLVLRPPTAQGGGLYVEAERAVAGPERVAWLRAVGSDGQLLAREPLRFPARNKKAKALLDLPTELRNRLARLDIEGQTTAASVVLVDERWRRRPVGLLDREGGLADQPLLSALFYLERALSPFTEIRRGGLESLFGRELAVMVFADPGRLEPAKRRKVEDWIKAGGVLVRFAGPRLAQDPKSLTPVNLRQGDRAMGGALSWNEPAALASFGKSSPFHGLKIPSDVRIRRQVLAQPSLDLADKTWARLNDGTPLVTADRREKGWLVLVHTAANVSWSNLPISGLFVDMLRRLVALSQGVVAKPGGPPLAPRQTLDGFGRLQAPPPHAIAIAARNFANTPASPRHPPGLYGTERQRRALNLSAGLKPPAPLELSDAAVTEEIYEVKRETDLRPIFLGLALLLAVLDIFASLVLRGLIHFAGGAAALVVVVAGPFGAAAQSDDAFALTASLQTRIAYVLTGDRRVDQISHSGLKGLGLIVERRTAAHLGDPIGVTLDSANLALFPLLYWPITVDQPALTRAAAANVNAFLRNGGTIFFDTRDQQDDTEFGVLRELARVLDIPPVVQIPADHVLSRTFYLLQEFPGRYTGGTLWVEREGQRVNDGVASVIVGSHDWVAAWAMDDAQRPIYSVVPGGDRQRELAFRFGINLVMYALTGNYKSDQVHAPAILERLGQ